MSRERATPNSAFTLVELLAVIAIIGILIALLLPAVQAAREAARRMTCSNHLRQIALGVLNYELQYRVFPINIAHYDEGGVEGNGLSWMVGILPFVEQQPLYDSMNLDGPVQGMLGIVRPENFEAVKTPLALYYCPSDNAVGEVKTDVWYLPSSIADLPFAVTNYSGVIGPHNCGNVSIWGGEPDCHNFKYGFKECLGTFWRHSHMAPVTLASFRDGTSRTIIVGEVLPEYDAFCYWATSNGVQDGTHAPLNWIPDPNQPWDGWPDQGGFRSRHPGGAHFAWADGHVTFMEDSIDRDLYRALSTRHKGEVLYEER